MSAWIFLAIAIAVEVCGTFLLKLSDGFAKWHWGALAIVCYAVSIFSLAPAVKVIPRGLRNLVRGRYCGHHLDRLVRL